MKLQSCTHECALWVDFVAEVAVDYVRRRDLTCSFSEYLRGCALPVCVCMPAIRLTGRAAPAGVRRSPRSTACGGDLHGDEDGEGKKQRLRRTAMKDVRTLLRRAYVRRQLPHTGSATLTAFGAAEEREPAEGRHTDDSEFEMLT